MIVLPQGFIMNEPYDATKSFIFTPPHAPNDLDWDIDDDDEDDEEELEVQE